MDNIQSVIGDCKSFLDKIFSNLKNAGFGNDEFQELDHIAYRAESLESYEEIKKKLTDFCVSLSDEIFAGRPILVCRLKDPLAYSEFKIAGIEVLAPKEYNKFKEGLEHAEFVIKTTLPEFLEKHKNINFNLDAYNREDNPELIIEFENCAVKFHTQSLLEIRKI